MANIGETLPDLRSAAYYFIKHMLHGDGYVNGKCDGKRGPVAYRISDLRTFKEDRVYYVAYNRRLLENFGRIFDIPSESDSIAQTIHYSVMFEAHNCEKSYIVIMMPDKSAYTILASRWVAYDAAYASHRIIPGESELSCSIPIKFMHQFEEDEPKGAESMMSYL